MGSLLACTGQSSGGDANIRSAQKYPYRFHTYTPHIYVDAFLNDSLPIRMVYDCAAPFVWLDSTFVDNNYGYESKQTMAFEGIGTGGRQVVKALWGGASGLSVSGSVMSFASEIHGSRFTLLDFFCNKSY